MILFPVVQMARDGLDRSPIAYAVLTWSYTATPYRTLLTLHGSDDGLIYRLRQMRGDLPQMAARGQLRFSTNAPNMTVVNGRLVLVSDFAESASGPRRVAIFSTINGWDWRLSSTPYDGFVGDRQVIGICRFGNDLVVVLRTGETLVSSDNGLTWEEGANTGLANVSGIAASASAVVVTTTNGLLKSSTNPRASWTSRTSQFGTASISAIAATSSQFVIVGAGGRISTAGAAGDTWTARSSGTTDLLVYVIKTSSRWFVGGSSAASNRTSTDGTTWGAPSSNYWAGDYFRVLRFVAGGDKSVVHWGGGVSYTTDGTNFQQAGDPPWPLYANIEAAYLGG